MKKINSTLPDWFDGHIYDEGDTITNPFSGESYDLNAESEMDKQLSTVDLLEAYPTLFKRPIIKYHNENYSFGWTTDIIKKIQSLEK